MLRIVVELTNRCNFRCLHCLREHSQRPEDFPLDLLYKLLEESRVFGRIGLHLTGGEPLLHSNFEKIIFSLIKYRSRLNYCYIVTNGWYFKETLPLFLSLNKVIPMRVFFSLDGVRKITHDKIRKDGAYQRTMEAILLCKKKYLPFGVQMVIHKYNESEVEKMADFVLDIKARDSATSLASVIPTPDLMKNNLLFSFKEIKTLQEKIKRLYQEKIYKKEISFLRRYDFGSCCPCYFDNNVVNINYQGYLTFCCNLSNYVNSMNNKSDIIGSLKKMNFLTLYEKFLHLFFKFHKDKIKYVQDKKVNWEKVSSPFLTVRCVYCLRYFRKIQRIKILEDYGIFI